MHTYKDSGVDKEEGYKAVDKIKSKVTETHNENVLTGLGSFASLYALKDYKNPVLVSGTCGKLDSDVSSEIVMGMAEACKDAACALVGGETAEMPGFYKDGDYDMAGFCVGAVERDRIINGKDVEEGDIILGLASSGVHSNGFSLIRSLVTDLDEDFQGEPVYKELLKPTRVYVRNVLKLLESHFEHISGMAHITGGGLPENLPRTIPEGLCGKIMKDSVPVLPIFDWLRGKGVPDEEMWGTFNMGVGFILIVRAEQKELIVSTLETLGESVAILGQIIKSDKKICLI
jgi:phosphoribosylformylglycinamidine cyclo-ligase